MPGLTRLVCVGMCHEELWIYAVCSCWYVGVLIWSVEGADVWWLIGNYAMKTWVTLKNGSKWAFRLDGLITRTATTGGNMIAIQGANDFEFYSANSAGGIQGAGYQCRNAG